MQPHDEMFLRFEWTDLIFMIYRLIMFNKLLLLTIGICNLYFYVRKAVLVYSPSGSLWDCVDSAAGVDHSRPRLQQQLEERSLPEKLLKLLVTH